MGASERETDSVKKNNRQSQDLFQVRLARGNDRRERDARHERSQAENKARSPFRNPFAFTLAPLGFEFEF
jgi:hypothetical protein